MKHDENNGIINMKMMECENMAKIMKHLNNMRMMEYVNCEIHGI